MLFFLATDAPARHRLFSIDPDMPYINVYVYSWLFLAFSYLLGASIHTLLIQRYSQGFSWPNLPLKLFFDACTGITTVALAAFLLGLVGWFNQATMAGMAMLAIWLYWHTHRKCPVTPVVAQTSRWLWLALFLLASSFIMQGFIAPGHWDDTSYHLPLARGYVENGGIVLDPWVRFPLFPQNIQMLFGIGLLFGDAHMAQGFNGMLVFLHCLGIHAVCQWLFRNALPGLLAIAVFITTPAIRISLGYAYIDIGMSLFCFAAVAGVALWAQNKEKNTFVLLVSALCMAMAVGSKFLALPLLGILVAWIAIVERQWRKALVFALVAGFFGSGWYLRSYVISGDPVHPIGSPYFGHFLWTEADWRAQAAEQHSHGSTKTLWSLMDAIWKARLPVIACGFLSVLFIGRMPAPLRLFYCSSLLYFLFWFYSSQVMRYIAPAVGMASVLLVYAISQTTLMLAAWNAIRLKPWQQRASSIAVVLCVIASLCYFQKSTQHALHAIRTQQEKLDSTTGYTIMQHANALMATHGRNMVGIGFENARFFFHGTLIGDVFGPGRYGQFERWDESGVSILPEQALAEKMQAFNASMIAVNTRGKSFDSQQYQHLFSVPYEGADGVLLILKQPPRSP